VTSARPRVLFLSVRFLFPLDTGGKIRTAKLLEQLAGRWDITLVSPYDVRTDEGHEAALARVAQRFVGVPPKTRSRGAQRMHGAWRRLRSALPMAVLNVASPGLQAAVARELAENAYDLVVCDFLHNAVNLPDPLAVPTLLFTHNVESRITRRHLDEARGLAAFYWRIEHRRMLAYERLAPRRFTRVVAVSESDRAELETLGAPAVRTIPTGVDTVELAPSGAPPRPGVIVFCGSMDWLPNQDAVRWFTSDILPRVRAQDPTARLLVVGKAPPAEWRAGVERAAGGAVSFTGWVEDVRPYLDTATCAVVPLRVGGGTRIKIYEAIAMACPVVSTTIGVEGLPLEHGRHYLRADEPAAFAEAVARLLRDPAGAAALAKEARAYVAARFGWEAVADAFVRIGNEAMAARA
jgi:polysaccharide biosynthesis protein PslH